MTQTETYQSLPVADESDESKQVWFTALAWSALISLILLPLLPKMPAAMNLGAFLGLITIGIYTIHFKREILDNNVLKLILMIFLLHGLANSIYPAILASDRDLLLRQCLHRYFDTIKAVIASCLILICLKNKLNLATFHSLALLTGFAICLYSPFAFWLQGELPTYYNGSIGLHGPRGNAHRYAVLLSYLSAVYTMMVFTPSLREAELPSWVRKTGYLLSIIAPLAFLRKGIPDNAGKALIPYLTTPAAPLSFYILAAATGLATAFFWRFIIRQGKSRAIAASVVLMMVIINLFMSAVRLQLFLSLLILVGALGLRYSLKLVILILFLILLLGGFAFSQQQGGRSNLSSFYQRTRIWKGSALIASDNPYFGVGYGTSAFYNAYSKRYRTGEKTKEMVKYNIPDTAYHAHNLWLELAAERGILGLIVFHILWIAVAVMVWRRFVACEDPDSRYPLYVSLILLIILGIEGLLNWSLLKFNESLFWAVVTLGVATSQTVKTKTTVKPDSKPN